MNKEELDKYFSYDHLPPHLQNVSRPLCEVARQIDDLVPAGPQKDIAMQKILEAKDAVVRQVLMGGVE